MNNGPDKRTMEKVMRRTDNRMSSRSGVQITAEIRQRADFKVTAEILDLSLSGFRMHCVVSLNDELPLHMTLPGFAPQSSIVRWVKGYEYGCEFSSPLYPAVYDHIVSAFPSLGKAS